MKALVLVGILLSVMTPAVAGTTFDLAPECASLTLDVVREDRGVIYVAGSLFYCGGFTAAVEGVALRLGDLVTVSLVEHRAPGVDIPLWISYDLATRNGAWGPMLGAAVIKSP